MRVNPIMANICGYREEIGMHRTPEQWAKVKPDAFLTGSIQQARNIIEMMQQDIAKQAAKIAVLEADKEKLQTDLDAEREFLKQERAYHAAGLNREERRERDH